MKIPKLHSMRKPYATIVAIIAMLMAGAGIAYAATQQSIVQGTTDHTVYKAGQDVNITGTVNGDIYCAGQDIVIDANVTGDVLCAGQTVTVNGTVDGNIRVAGQTITLGAKVTRNVSLAGQDITLQNNASIGRDASIVGQTVTVEGPIERDVDVAANTVTFNNLIGRNVSATVGNKLILGSSSNVEGNVSYTSPRLWQKSSGAQVLGLISYHKQTTHRHTGWFVVAKVILEVIVLVLAIALVALFPQFFRKGNQIARKHYGFVLLTGFIAVFLMPILIFALFATLIGSLLGGLLLLLWISTILVSVPMSMYVLGSQIVPKFHPVLIALIGGVILGIIELIPIVGWIVTVLAVLFGVGTLLWNFKRLYQKPNYAPKS